MILAWFALETPVLERVKLSTTPGNAVRWALHSLAAGSRARPFGRLPDRRAAPVFRRRSRLGHHGGGRVLILGHAGRHDLLGGKIIWLRWVVGLLVLAAATRMSADFLPDIRSSHLIYAAWPWALGGAIWLGALATFSSATKLRQT